MNFHKQPVKSITSLVGFFICVAITVGCEQQLANTIVFSGETMGTTYHIKIPVESTKATSDGLKEDVNQLLLEINQSFSTYIESSEVSQFNKYQGIEGQVRSSSFFEVLEEALRISELTDGAYDITVGPLVNLWGFGPGFKKDNLPVSDEITLALNRVGYKKIAVDHKNKTIKKLAPGLYIDFSSIAKGYGVDKVAKLVESNGYANYMVEIGGEMRVRGVNAEGTSWRIAVEKPDSSGRSIHRVINVTDTAIATSGDYRNFFEKDGVKFSHTINPNTGQPVQHNLSAVTVLASSCMTADAWATAFMVLGGKKGYDLAMDNKLAVLFLIREGVDVKEVMTPYFKAKLDGQDR